MRCVITTAHKKKHLRVFENFWYVQQQLLQLRPAPFSRNTDTTSMLQHHFLNAVWPSNLQRDWERSLPSHFLHHRMARSEFLFLDQPLALPLRCGATCCNHKTQRISLPGGSTRFLQETCAWKRQLGHSPKTIQSNLICFCSTLESRMLLNMQPNYYYE